MKPLHLIFLAISFSNVTFSQIVNIPDNNFKQALISVGVDANGDGNIQVEEAKATEALFLGSKGIVDLTGIEAFENLKDLGVGGNNISGLSFSSNLKLERLWCSGSRLRTLSVSENTALTILDCSNNQLRTLDLSTNKKLKRLTCNNASLYELNVPNGGDLEFINASSNWLREAKFWNFLFLKEIDISFNSINTAVILSNIPLLEKLDCSINQDLPKLDLTGLPKLKHLDCTLNDLDTLEVGHLEELIILRCSSNSISSLDNENMPELEILDFSNNNITDLDTRNNPKLIELSIGSNAVQEIDLSLTPNLEVLNCWNCGLSELDISFAPNLTTLACGRNNLQELNISFTPNLIELAFDDNNIKTIDLSNVKNLENLRLNSTEIQNLDLSNLPKLKNLSCYSNDIKILDFRRNVLLERVSAWSCPLEFLYILNGRDDSNIINVSDDILFICADDIEVDAFRRELAPGGEINSFCAYNPAGAEFKISGKCFFDFNSDGCDVNDQLLPFTKIEITNDQNIGFVHTNQSGEFRVLVNDGNYEIAPAVENAQYFKATPESLIVEFPGDGDSIIQDFCLSAQEDIDDLEITILPLGGARPGFEADYKITYYNKGTTTLSGEINFSFDSELVEFLSASPVEDEATTNSLKWSYWNLRPFEKGELFVTMKLNSPMDTPALNGGDILNFKAIIGPRDNDFKANDNVACLEQDVVNSFDPNDKRCLEGNTIFEELIGEYVHYMIRFENTGTAEAINVLVTDEIDITKFDITSLQITDSSHDMETRITDGNNVEFIFENIYLPFEDSLNDGYVVFKIKTLPTLSVGDTFENEANIFFDFNFPIKTNLASTSINLMTSTEENVLENIHVDVYPNPTSGVVNVECEDIVSKVSIYNAQGLMVKEVSIIGQSKNLKINVASLISGIYYLKVESDNGVTVKDIVVK